MGYDPKGTDRTGDTTGTWKSTLAAVSVGDAVNKLTRQITGVAAGTEATDAVNVAQLQEAVAASGSSSGLEENSNALSFKDNTLSLSIKDKAGTEVTGSVNLSTIASAIDTRNTLATPTATARFLSTARKRMISAERITRSKSIPTAR